MVCPTTPVSNLTGLGCFRFARRDLENRICFLFLWVLRCFSSPGLPRAPYVFRYTYCSITNSGFPHSEISGSQFTYNSPKHIGVSPVLHQLLVRSEEHTSELLSRFDIVCRLLFEKKKWL